MRETVDDDIVDVGTITIPVQSRDETVTRPGNSGCQFRERPRCRIVGAP